MSVGKPQPPPERRVSPVSERLDSWKEIAAYLKRDGSTVRRWEKEGLPVHRLAHKKKATICAYTSEIDDWWKAGRARLEAAELAAAGRHRSRVWWAAAGLVVLGVAVGLGLNMAGVRDQLLGRPVAGEITSIAVLPLKNLSGEPGQDYFADGMTEALITELGKIGRLQVLSFQSVSRYRQTQKPLPEIVRELRVDALLEGSLVRSGDRVRITAKLFQAAPERQLLSESFEFDARNVLAVQAEVARDIATRARIRLTPQEQARLATARVVDPEAYEAYLLGRAYFLQYGPGTPPKAKAYFEKSIAKDPNFAPAYASLAELLAGRLWAFPIAAARARDVVIITDEVYHNYVYGGTHASGLQVDPGLENVVMVNSFSKAFAIMGWRMGYVVAHPWLIQQMDIYKESVSACSFSIGQWAIAEYLDSCASYLAWAHDFCQGNMRLMVDRLRSIPGVEVAAPQGSLYVFADFSAVEASSARLTERLLRGGLAISGGTAFGPHGEGCARLLFSAPTEDVARAVDRIEAVLAG